MALPELEVNDIISTKDGRSLRILSIYKSGNEVIRLDGVDDNAPTPMRIVVYANNIAKILQKHKVPEPVVEPKKPGRPKAEVAK